MSCHFRSLLEVLNIADQLTEARIVEKGHARLQKASRPANGLVAIPEFRRDNTHPTVVENIFARRGSAE